MDKNTYEFISQQTNDQIVERRKCRRTGEDFPVFQGDIDLLNKISPVITGKKYPLPLPTLNFQARDRRRMMRRNDRHLYRATCADSGKPIITFYHPDKQYSIIDNKDRFEVADNTKYGQAFDFSRPFYEQLFELGEKTTKQNTLIVGLMENSTYTHNVGNMKDSYMCFDGGGGDNVFYTTRFGQSEFVIDCFEVMYSSHCYQCSEIGHCNNCFYTVKSNNCSYGVFNYQCDNCHHCIGCSNLVGKSYYIKNKEVSEEEFNKVWQQIFSGSHKIVEDWKQYFSTTLQSTMRPSLRMINSENSLGNNILQCKDTVLCEDCSGTDNVRYSKRLNYLDPKDIMDISSRGGHMSRCYELNCCGTNSHTMMDNCHFSSYLFYGVDFTQYSINIQKNGSELFGCYDIHTKKNHILNKQYTKKEYENLIPKIIEHMQKTGERGEFIDPRYSPFPYNDTMAQDYYPIHSLVYPDGRREVVNLKGTGDMYIQEPDKTISPAYLDLGAERIYTTRRTKDIDVTIPDNIETIDSSLLPDNLDKIDNSILNKAIICELSKKPFRIVAKELALYRKWGVPLPRLHPDLRYQQVLEHKQAFNFHLRSCSDTGEKIVSVYPENTTFDVYNPKSYKDKIYG